MVHFMTNMKSFETFFNYHIFKEDKHYIYLLDNTELRFNIVLGEFDNNFLKCPNIEFEETILNKVHKMFPFNIKFVDNDWNDTKEFLIYCYEKY